MAHQRPAAMKSHATAVTLALILFASLVAAQELPVSAAQPTRLILNAPPSIHLGDEWRADAILTDSLGNPLGGLTVNWFLDGQFQQPGTTASDGSSFLGVGGWVPTLGNNTVSVSFDGTSSYLASNATAVIDVLAANPITYTTTTGTVKTGPVVDLNPSNGVTVCPMYFRGNASGGVWDESTLTCTLAGGGNVYPTFCVSSSGGGCGTSAIGKLVIDRNVTVVINNGGNMAIYSELDNYGTLNSDIVNYGVIQNHGIIDFNATNQLLNLPFNGLGLINNTEGASINNWYYITNAGIIDNHGIINNYGQFISQECSPCMTGTLVNDGTYVGSAPAPVFTSTVDLTGGNGTANQNSTAGITVKISGASGNKVTVSTQVQGSQAPPGIGSVQLGSTSYYDVLITGTRTGIATVCITSEAPNSTKAEIEYWNGTAWNGATGQTVSGGSPPFTYCGDIPVSALVGTPLAVGTVTQTTNPTTITTGATLTHSTSENTPSAQPSLASWLEAPLALMVAALTVAGLAIVLVRGRTHQ